MYIYIYIYIYTYMRRVWEGLWGPLMNCLFSLKILLPYQMVSSYIYIYILIYIQLEPYIWSMICRFKCNCGKNKNMGPVSIALGTPAKFTFALVAARQSFTPCTLLWPSFSADLRGCSSCSSCQATTQGSTGLSTKASILLVASTTKRNRLSWLQTHTHRTPPHRQAVRQLSA